MKRRFDLYLRDILERIERIHEYLGEKTFEEFQNDFILKDAVILNLEVIGEAASQLQSHIKQKYAQVPWQEIIDFRNVIIHKYNQVDFEVAWNVIVNELDSLERQIKEILKPEGLL